MRIAHPANGRKLLVRNYSVEGHFRLMGFKNEKINFGEQSYTQLCKMAPNGWDINLVSILFKHIFEQLRGVTFKSKKKKFVMKSFYSLKRNISCLTIQ